MSAFIPLKRNCPICNGARSDCRQSRSTNLIFCRHTDANPIGFKFQREDAHGFSVWAEAKVDEWSDQQRQEYQRRKQERERFEQQRLSGALPIPDRNRAIRKLHKYLGLSSKHRQDLRDRSLTDAHIDAGCFFSIHPDQELPPNIPANLPGVMRGKLAAGAAGFACPAFDVHGNIIGWQLRVDETTYGKYRWPKGSKSSHLANGELPITVCRPIDGVKRPGVGLAEGLLKPYVGAQKLGQIFIGAAGGNFTSSPEQLKASLEALKPDIVNLYPDAGAVNNSHIMRQYRRTIELVSSWGYAVRVVWWGQTTKDAADVDELTGTEALAYLTPSDFLGESEPDAEPDSGAYAEYIQRLEDEERYADLDQERRHSEWRDQFPQRAHSAWKRSKRFSPTQSIDQQYFDFAVPCEGSLMAVKSGLGTGKTEWLKRVIQVLSDEGWIALGYRNSLLLQSCERWGFYHLHADNGFMFIPDSQSKLALCVDSLGHFQRHHFDGKNIVLDEAMSVTLHLLAGGTIRDKRDRCLELFTEALKRAKRIFVLDGHLADWCLEYLQKLCGGDRKVIKVANQYQSTPLDIEFLLGTPDLKGGLSANDRSPLIAAIKQSPRRVICADSQIEAEALDNILALQGCKGIRLDSKTISEPWASEFLANPDAWIEKHRPDYLILSPTAESGIDISIRGYFTDQYCLYFGVLHTDAQLQMMGRIRDPQVKRHIWCREFGTDNTENFRSPFPRQITKAVEDFLIQDGIATIEGIDQSAAIEQLIKKLIAASQDDHYHAFNLLKARWNYERSHLRECLLESLIEAGHNVRLVTLQRDEGEADALKDAKDEVKNANSVAIFNAQDIDPNKVSEIDAKFSASWEQRCEVKKARLKKRLPGIEKTPQWRFELIRKVEYDDRAFIEHCELFWLLHHPDAAKLQQQERWAWLLKKDKTFLGDIRSRHLKVKTLLEIGILDFLDLEREWSDRTPEVLELKNKCKAKRVATALGLSVGNSEPIRFLARMLRQLGIKLQPRRRRVDGEVLTVYRIDPKSWNDPDRAAVLGCLDTRWQKYQDSSVSAPDFGVASVSIPTPKNCVKDTPETVVTTESDPDHLSPYLYINNRHKAIALEPPSYTANQYPLTNLDEQGGAAVNTGEENWHTENFPAADELAQPQSVATAVATPRRWAVGMKCLSDAFIGHICRILEVNLGLFDTVVIVPEDEPERHPHTVSMAGLRVAT
jgi:hypothetical protein